MRELLLKNRISVTGFGILWLAFACVEVAQRYYFSGQFLKWFQFDILAYAARSPLSRRRRGRLFAILDSRAA